MDDGGWMEDEGLLDRVGLTFWLPDIRDVQVLSSLYTVCKYVIKDA